jgi:quercetin dioxygenase-like cupin family protein
MDESESRKASWSDRRRETVAETASLRVVEWTLGAGDSLPWHHHSQVHDTFYCLEGLIGVDTRLPEQHVILRPGEKYVVPANVVHRPENLGNGTGRFLLIQGLGTYDFIPA